MREAKILQSVIAVSLLAAANCVNSCLSEYACSRNTARLELSRVCGITDADVPDIQACMDQMGRATITHLKLADTLLTTLPGDMLHGLPQLRHLDLHSNGLTSLPAGVFDGMVNLKELMLSDNELTSLPADIFKDTRGLISLKIDDNKLESLPPGVFDSMPVLVFMNIAGNPFSTLPPSCFKHTTLLKHMFISFEHPTNLPERIFDGAASITQLKVSGDMQASLPPGFFSGLTSLTSLSLRNSSIALLPAAIFEDLPKLVVLDLSGNQLTTLPDELFGSRRGVEKLTMHLENNPDLHCPPTSGADHVLLDIAKNATLGACGCTPVEAATDEHGLLCHFGSQDYTCRQDGLLDCLIVASDVHMKQREDTYVETREDNNHKDGLFRKAILQGLIMFYLGCLGLILLYRRYECGVLRRFCAGFRRGSRRGIGLTLSVR